MAKKKNKSKQTRLDRDKFLDDDEYDSLLRLVSREPMTRDKILIQLALMTGARASELLNLTVKDLNATMRTVYVKGLKGSDDREVPLSKELFKLVQGLEADKKGKLFPITYQRLYQIWGTFAPQKNALEVRPKTFHSLRHTCAVRLYKKSRDIKVVQTILGHRDLRNTMIYVDFVYSQEKLREAMGV
jgi:integrase/recombinase XerC